MNAEIKPSYDPNRQKLADIIPLSTPFTVYIEPTRYCNFKCFYCMHSTRGQKDGAFARTGYALKHLASEQYERLLNQLSRFPEKIKRIVFSGLGEPLMNPRLPEMIALARQRGVTDRIDVITNGTLLTHERSEALVRAGLSRLQISLQGLTAEKYHEVCGVAVDMEKLAEEIAYFYQNKGASTVFIKIIDALLEGERQREQFFQSFGSLCDQIFVEHLITLEQQMGDHGGRADNTRNMNNEVYRDSQVCPVIFYHLQVDVDGHVFPCPVPGLPSSFAMGNMMQTPLYEIWNGNAHMRLMRGHLEGKRKVLPVCDTCVTYACIINENERLDDDAARTLRQLENHRKGICL